MLSPPPYFRSAFLKFAYIYPFIQLLVFLPLQWVREDHDRDSVAYFLAAERIQNGADLYDPLPPPGPHVIDAPYYLYPPFLASAIALFPLTTYETFARIWLLTLLAAFWIFAASIGRMAAGRTTLRGTLLAGAGLALVPGVIRGLNLGQADVLMWAMVGVGIAYPFGRGPGFMFAALTKVHGMWPLLVSAWREGRSTVRNATIAIVVAVGISVSVLGPAQFARSSMVWFSKVAPALSQGQFEPPENPAPIFVPLGKDGLAFRDLIPSNLSLSFAPLLLARHLEIWNPGSGPLPLPLRLYLAIVSMGAPILIAWFFRKQPVDLQCSLVLAGAILFSPIVRITILPIMLLPAVIYFSRKVRGGALESAPA